MVFSNNESISVPRAIVKFAVPTILSQIVTLIYNLADTFFVGHTGDPNQVAALTLCFPVFMLLTAIGNLMGIGANSLIARSLGSGDTKTARQAGTFGIYGSIIFTALLAFALYLGMDPILILLGVSDNTYPLAKTYIMWTVVIGGFPSILSLVLAHLIRAEGNSKQAGIGLSMGGIINIILDYLFVSYLGHGVAGAAIATTLSNTLSAGYFICLLILNRKKTVISLQPKHFCLCRNIVFDVLLVGSSAALVVLLGSCANIVLTHCMAPYGDFSIAASASSKKLAQLPSKLPLVLPRGLCRLSVSTTH